MLNVFKSGLTKKGYKLVAPTMHTPQLNQVKTCSIKIC